MLRDKSQGNPQFEFIGTSRGDKILVPASRITKMASSHDGTCPRHLLQGLVPSCVQTFSLRLSSIDVAALQIFRKLRWIKLHRCFRLIRRDSDLSELLMQLLIF